MELEIQYPENSYKFSSIKINDNTQLQYVTNIFDLHGNTLANSNIKKDVDVIKNIYEGGCKVWECTIDILDYLSKNENLYNFKDKQILDLGCGHGLIGIYALMKGAKFVCFQDYNKEVLQYFTEINVKKRAAYISCDWSDAQSQIELITTSSFNLQQKFDYIISSETLYNIDNYDKIYQLTSKLINPNGQNIFGSKLYYFGCGGSIIDFKQFLKQKNQDTVISTLARYGDKNANKREIFQYK